MKKQLLTFLLLFCTFTGVFAQPSQEKLESLKMAFITRELNLGMEEAQKFWPVYNQFTAETKKIHQDYTGKDQLEMQQKLLDLKKKYKPEFLKAVSSDKFDKLLVVEEQWKEKLRQELDRRRLQRQNRSNFEHLF